MDDFLNNKRLCNVCKEKLTTINAEVSPGWQVHVRYLPGIREAELHLNLHARRQRLHQAENARAQAAYRSKAQVRVSAVRGYKQAFRLGPGAVALVPYDGPAC
jgi:hypothetical protein